LLMLFPTEYPRLPQNSVSLAGDNLKAERRLCDVDHCQIGDYLAESWNFPVELIDVIAHHHDTAGPETPKLRLLVQAACTAANMSGFHAAGTGWAWESGRMMDLLPPANARLLPPAEGMRDRVAAAFNDIERGLS
jgi:HD-like signal output (HDOD) protein